jgi:hypothetical protein
MFKKLTLLALSVAALAAFAVPAAAQAEVIVTDQLGNEATHLEAVSENTISMTGLGTLDCDTVNLTLEGETGHYHGSGTAEGGGVEPDKGPCISQPSGLLVDVTSITATVSLAGGGTGTADFEYNFLLTGSGFTLSCKFVSTGASVKYTPEGNEISIAGTMTGSGAGCPTSGSISGDFTVTSESEAVIIH